MRMETGAFRTRIQYWLKPVALAALLFSTFVKGSAQRSPIEQVISPRGPVLTLDEVGLYSIGCEYRNGRKVSFPLGWSGDFDATTGVAYRSFGVQHGKPGTLIHCPWRHGTGVTFQDFWIKVPRLPKVLLTSSIALATYAVGKSDGVTFRVYVNSERVFEENRKDDEWKNLSIDLTRFAGHNLKLRFETDPGPRDDASHDFSLWANRKLIMNGLPETPVSRGSNSKVHLLAASSVGSNDVVPTDGDPGNATISVRRDHAALIWTGDTERFEYDWRLPHGPGDPLFGSISLSRHTKGFPSESTSMAPLATSAHIDWSGPAKWVSVRPIQMAGAFGCVQTFEVEGKPAHLKILGRLIGKCFVLDITCDQGVVDNFTSGGWGPVAFRRLVTTPYFSGQVQYLPVQDLFVNSYLDWTSSVASNHDGNRAAYWTLTNGKRNLLKERAIFAASTHLAGALPSIPNPKSPYIRQVGGRIVLDTWGGKFSSIEKDLESLSDYGITDCTVIVHVWQRSGYDNALPAHIPANESMGGDPEMQGLVATGRRLGYLVALHENYVDYYPNFEGFRESDIALDSSGRRTLAWFQPGTKIQSFAIQPNSILPLANSQSPEIHRRFATNADYLDVHSAVPPWFHVDLRAGETGAGSFHQVWEAHRKLWAFERQTHGGPVFGEGANHWFWSGLLDGVEAQFGAGWPGGLGMSAPLMVDFDLLRIHPLQANHGMGYYERWWENSPWSGLPPMSVLDQYRMQEVAFGHTGFLGSSTWNVIPLAWLEHHLLGPVTSAYAGMRPSRIEYQVQGDWIDPDSAAKEAEWSRVRVTYENGLSIVANSRPEPLNVGSLVLPQFGWSASGAGITAWTALRNGSIADYSESKDRVFANARNAAAWNISGIRMIRPEVKEFRQTGYRRFHISYRWHIGETLNRDYRPFVHFSTRTADPGDEGIRFQGDHVSPSPTSSWQPNTIVEDEPGEVVIPNGVTDGVYSIGVGLFQENEPRPLLQGSSDSHGRIVVGSLAVSESGRTIRFVPNPEPHTGRTDLYQKNLNQGGTVIDFGSLRTNGSVHIVRQGREWVMQTFPRNTRFELELNSERFGTPKQVTCVGVKSLPFQPIVKNGFWRMMLNSAREYRWSAQLAMPVNSRKRVISSRSKGVRSGRKRS